MTDSSTSEHHTLSMGGLRISWTTPSSGRAELALDGDLDTLSVPVLRQALDGLYDEGSFQIELDLVDLAFVDSSGLGALVAAWRRCQHEGGSLVVRHPSSPVRRLMDMTGISKFLLPPS